MSMYGLPCSLDHLIGFQLTRVKVREFEGMLFNDALSQ